MIKSSDCYINQLDTILNLVAEGLNQRFPNGRDPKAPTNKNGIYFQ